MASINCPFRAPLSQGLALKAYSYLTSVRTETSSWNLSAGWRAYPLKGDTARAKAAYRDFLAPSKDADPDNENGNAAKAERESSAA